MAVCYYVLNWVRNYKGKNDTFQRHWLFVNMPITKEDKILIKICLSWKATMRPAVMAQRANMLAELQCGPGWLARRHGFDSCCWHVESGSAWLNSRAGTRGFACVLFLNCDRPSHLDWGRLGVMRAAGIDNRWQLPAALLVGQGRTISTLP